MSESDDLTASGEEPRRISVSEHERRLRDMRCVVTESFPVSLHHCHSGSMCELGPEFPNPGWAQKQNPFLQIPLHIDVHVGPRGIDGSLGVIYWEGLYGSQVEMLHEVNSLLPYDIFEQARLWQNKTG